MAEGVKVMGQGRSGPSLKLGQKIIFLKKRSRPSLRFVPSLTNTYMDDHTSGTENNIEHEYLTVVKK